MTAAEPTILATSGGFTRGRRTLMSPGPLIELAIELAAERPSPGPLRLTFLPTATGDQAGVQGRLHEAFYGRRDVEVTVAHLFPMPNLDDLGKHLLAQDAIWVGGGSVVNLLAVWRAHGLDTVMRQAWEGGIVLSGVSAGSICWHRGGTTDSFGPDLQAVTDALALLPYGNGVHYDSEAGRRPLLHALVADGTLPTSYATDDGAGLLYRGSTFVEALADREQAHGYRVERVSDGAASETRLTTRLIS